jgi:hypothetical protein
MAVTSDYIFFKKFFFFYCCAGWGYIVAFTKVITMYLISHTWIPPSTAVLHSCNNFNNYHFCIYIHVYTFFAPYSSSYPCSLPPLSSHWCQPFCQGRTCSALLFSNFVKEKREKVERKIWPFCWFEIKVVATQGGSLFYIYIYIYIHNLSICLLELHVV